MFQTLEGTGAGVAVAAASVLIAIALVPVLAAYRLLRHHELSMLLMCRTDWHGDCRVPLGHLRLCTTHGVAVTHEDHVHPVGAAERLEVTVRVAQNREENPLVWLLTQVDLDRVGLSTLCPFVATRELHAELRRCSSVKAHGNTAALFAVLHFDAAPAIAAAHQVISEAAARIAAKMLGIGNVLTPATRKIRCLEVSRCRTCRSHHAAESSR
jgi:hypothetical protein